MQDGAQLLAASADVAHDAVPPATSGARERLKRADGHLAVEVRLGVEEHGRREHGVGLFACRSEEAFDEVCLASLCTVHDQLVEGGSRNEGHVVEVVLAQARRAYLVARAFAEGLKQLLVGGGVMAWQGRAPAPHAVACKRVVLGSQQGEGVGLHAASLLRQEVGIEAVVGHVVGLPAPQVRIEGRAMGRIGGAEGFVERAKRGESLGSGRGADSA